MKKILFLLIALMLFGTSMKAQWNLYLTGQTSFIDEISVVNENVIWVTDMNATSFSITTDGGTSWQTKNFPPEIISSRSNAGGNGNISGINATTAFICIGQGSNMGLFKTIDSGYTWIRQGSVFNSASSFPDFVYFWNENDGVVIGDGGTNPGFEIYTTSDGGNIWNVVSYDKLPAIANSWTINSNSFYKVMGNTFYFGTNNGQIMKSTNKGLTWTLMNTPLTGMNYMSFDFKDVNNGLLSDYNISNKTALLYSTSNGGTTWSLVKTSTSENYSDLRYIPSQNVYTNVCQGYVNNYGGKGLSYSSDNGLTWVNNTSFQNMILGQISYTPMGKLFLGGIKYIYNSTSISGVNISVTDAKITGLNSIDITYSTNPDPVSSQLLSNYPVSYIKNKVLNSLSIQSLTLDATNKSIVHIQMQSNLPSDTIMVNLGDIKGSNGFSVLNKEIVFYNTAKTIHVNTAGTLQTLMTVDELANITNLNITGTIDARDFKSLRDTMPGLKYLDLSGSNVAEYNGSEGTYSSEITDYQANTLPVDAFYNPSTFQGKKSLTLIKLPTSVTSIGNNAFTYCSGLTSIAIPSSVTSIENNAFTYCTGLTSIAIPSSVTSIGNNAFTYCSGLTSIIIPSSVTSIGDQTFMDCTGLTSIMIPSSVTSIGAATFDFCSNLSNITIPWSVTSLGIQAFYACKGPISVDVNNPNYSSREGVLFNKNQTTLIQATLSQTGSYTIPSTVKSIGYGAFGRCNTGLTSVTIPSSVDSIGNYAFYFCTGLTSIKIPSSVTSIGNFAFGYCEGLESIYAYPVIPVDLSSSLNAFIGFYTLSCILYTPVNSLSNYKSATVWKDFWNMIAMTETSVQTETVDALILYPNPVKDGFQINGLEGTGVLTLLNLNGKIVLSKQISGNEYISVLTVPEGIYIMTLITSEAIIKKKIIIKQP